VSGRSALDVDGVDVDADFHGCSAGVVDRGREGDEIPDVDGFAEQYPVDGHGDDVAAGVVLAQAKATSSRISKIEPPCTLPEKLAMSGVIRTVMPTVVWRSVIAVSVSI
jgi:hypothetical protein